MDGYWEDTTDCDSPGGQDPMVVTAGTVSGTSYSASEQYIWGDPADCAYTIDRVFQAELIGDRLIGEWEMTFASFDGPGCPTQQEGMMPWPEGCVAAYQFEGERM